MRIRHSAFAIVFSAVIPGIAFAQDGGRTLKGSLRVWDTTVPFAGAAIRVIGTNSLVCADQWGRFEVPVPEGEATLRITPVGFAPYEVVLAAGRSEVALPMGDHVVLLDSVSVIGYSTPSVRAGPTAVSELSAADVGKVPASTVESTMQGKLAGAKISANSGAPGGGYSIGFRGVKTILGDADPVFVVDGTVISNAAIGSGSSIITGGGAQAENAVNRIADINPGDIESITVLRGPSAAARYGPRAGNGVVIISTRRGHRPEQTPEAEALRCFRPAG